MPASTPPATTYREDRLFRPAALGLHAGVFDLNGEHEVHGHDFTEVAVVAGGHGEHVTAHGRQPVGSGDVFVLRPGAWHGFAQCRGLVVANACVSATTLTGDLGFLRQLTPLRQLLWAGPVATGRRGVVSQRVPESNAAGAAEQIAVLQRRLADNPDNQVLLLGQLLTVLGHLVDNPEASAEAGTDRHELPTTVGTALEWLEGSPAFPWRLADLAHEVNLDPAYLSRLFRQAVGLPPMAYLARVRAEQAAQLLARSDFSAADIGARVGWPDPTYFSRRFRDLHGLTPTQYRRRCRRAPEQTHARWPVEHG